RQQTLSSGARPDFTFLLPNDLRLHMDVKFPFDNYFRSLEEENEAAAQRYRQTFIRDVRAKINEVASRGYVAPDANTLEFALLFVPNEQVFRAMFETSPEVLDEALGRGVLMASPVSLIAILALVRRASMQLRLQDATRELLALLADFRKAWDKNIEQQDRMGRRIEDLNDDYRLVTGERRRSIARIIDRLDLLMDGEAPESQQAEPQQAEPQRPGHQQSGPQ
ncbi:MAG: DNA recombination protein RmuC, partial [Pseudomonadota bacterium]